MIIRVELYLFPEWGTNVITRRMLYTLGLANLATPSSHPCSQVYSVDHCAAGWHTGRYARINYGHTGSEKTMYVCSR